jgi:hypothetical protein
VRERRRQLAEDDIAAQARQHAFGRREEPVGQTVLGQRVRLAPPVAAGRKITELKAKYARLALSLQVANILVNYGCNIMIKRN